MIRPITDTLRHIGGGIFIDMASDKMNELVSAVDASGKGGKLTLVTRLQVNFYSTPLHAGED